MRNPHALANLHRCEYIGPQLDADNNVVFHLFNDLDSGTTFSARSEAGFFKRLSEIREYGQQAAI